MCWRDTTCMAGGEAEGVCVRGRERHSSKVRVRRTMSTMMMGVLSELDEEEPDCCWVPSPTRATDDDDDVDTATVVTRGFETVVTAMLLGIAAEMSATGADMRWTAVSAWRVVVAIMVTVRLVVVLCSARKGISLARARRAVRTVTVMERCGICVYVEIACAAHSPS
jgi:hypothetical protein